MAKELLKSAKTGKVDTRLMKKLATIAEIDASEMIKEAQNIEKRAQSIEDEATKIKTNR